MLCARQQQGTGQQQHPRCKLCRELPRCMCTMSFRQRLPAPSTSGSLGNLRGLDATLCTGSQQVLWDGSTDSILL